MKNNWKLKGLIFLAALTSIGGLASCSVFGGDEAVTISKVEHVVNDDGSVTVTITYANEDMKPYEFTIPKSTGIAEVTSTFDEDENLVIVIKTTDGKEARYKIDSARSIDHVDYGIDEETGDTLMTIYYSDGTMEPEPIRIPKGEKGDPGDPGQDGMNGVGILPPIVVDVDPETGDTTITIILDDEDNTTSTFVIPAGTGIASVEPTQKDNQYVLLITLTNGKTIEVGFNRMPGWFSGSGMPAGIAAIEGDFYYDLDGQVIYQFHNGSWHVVVDFGGQATTDRRRVTFDLNAFDDEGNDDLNAYFVGSSSSRRTMADYCAKGHSFYDSHIDIPMPVRDGYDFLGWYTERNYNPVTSGRFDSLTTVWTDVTVYAAWEERSETTTYHTVNFVLGAEDAAFVDVAADIRNIKVSVPAGRTMEDINYPLPLASRDGFELLGWSIEPAATSVSLTASTPINANITAFAVWLEFVD